MLLPIDEAIHSATQEESAKNNSKENDQKKNKAIARRRPCPTPIVDRMEIGQIVLCRFSGWKEWPAVVIGFEKNLIKVKFFGDNTTFKAAPKNFFSFEESHETIIENLKFYKKPLYRKAVMEAESVLNVPPELSIFTRSGRKHDS